MSITTIADPTIRLVASKKLCKFVASLKPNEEMPKNISLIFSSHTGKSQTKVLNLEDVENIKYTEEEEKFLNELDIGASTETEFKELISPEDSDDEASSADEGAHKETNKGQSKKKTFHITLKDVKWLDRVLKERRKNGQTELYLHELLENCELVLPENEVIERNPELEARCVRLRRQQEEYEYHKMTRNVDNSFKDAPDDTISFQSESKWVETNYVTLL